MTNKTIIILAIALVIAITVPTIYATLETDNDVFCDEKISDGTTTFADLQCETLEIIKRLEIKITEQQPISNSTDITQLEKSIADLYQVKANVTDIENVKTTLQTYIELDINNMNELITKLNQTNTNVNQLTINANQTSMDVADLQQRVSLIESPPIEFTAKIDYKQATYNEGNIVFISGTIHPAYDDDKIIVMSVYDPEGFLVLTDMTIPIQSDNTFGKSIVLGEEWNILGKYTVEVSHHSQYNSIDLEFIME